MDKCENQMKNCTNQCKSCPKKNVPENQHADLSDKSKSNMDNHSNQINLTSDKNISVKKNDK